MSQLQMQTSLYKVPSKFQCNKNGHFYTRPSNFSTKMPSEIK